MGLIRRCTVQAYRGNATNGCGWEREIESVDGSASGCELLMAGIVPQLDCLYEDSTVFLAQLHYPATCMD